MWTSVTKLIVDGWRGAGRHHSVSTAAVWPLSPTVHVHPFHPLSLLPSCLSRNAVQPQCVCVCACLLTQLWLQSKRSQVSTIDKRANKSSSLVNTLIL